jgi:hypothetical protein
LAALGVAACALGLILGGDRLLRAVRTRNRILAFGLGLGTVLMIHRGRRHSSPPSVRDGVGGFQRGPVTPALVPVNPADTPLDGPGWNLEQRLDEALQETFPASDPIALHIE